MIQACFRIVAPADKREEILDVLTRLKGPTEASKACLACHILQEAENENVLTYIERWDTLQDVEEHIRSERFRRLLPYIEMSTEPPQVEFDTIEKIQGIEVLVTAIANGPSTDGRG